MAWPTIPPSYVMPIETKGAPRMSLTPSQPAAGSHEWHAARAARAQVEHPTLVSVAASLGCHEDELATCGICGRIHRAMYDAVGTYICTGTWGDPVWTNEMVTGDRKDGYDKVRARGIPPDSHTCSPEMGCGIPAAAHDPINHPQHYCAHPSGVECITIIEHFTHNVGAAIKYLWRAGLKYGNHATSNADIEAARLEDLQKARWYVDREIRRLTRERS